ncbi:MAG: nucleotide exchange factor GrpE [Patescibacteria group bacterium]|nr:nucleotide exchange factor GrpE [Patescibacteria group bacterium]
MEKKDKKEKKEKTGEPQDKLTKCEREREEYLNGWRRAKADIINYKKEEGQRFEQFAKLSNGLLISELIIILDSFNLGLTVLEKDSPAQKGMSLIKNQLEGILKKYGLEKIIVRPGDSFDPNYHEAVSEIESDKQAGTVAEEVEGGYILGSKVIRPARVKLSKGQNKNK